MFSNSIHDLLSIVSEVCVSWLQGGECLISPNVGLAHNNNVAVFSEGVWVEGYSLEDDFRIVSRGLPG